MQREDTEKQKTMVGSAKREQEHAQQALRDLLGERYYEVMPAWVKQPISTTKDGLTLLGGEGHLTTADLLRIVQAAAESEVASW